MSLSTKVVAWQWAHSWGDPAAALARLEAALESVPAADLILLPELCLTGYLSPQGDFDVRPFAETLDGPTCGAIARLAGQRRMAIAAPLVERDGARPRVYYNSLVLFDESGRRIGHWRERHPWFPEHWATPGNLGTPVVEWHGLGIAAAICYDLHFLAHEAAAQLRQADLLLFPSAWVEEGLDTRAARLAALARKFGLSIVNANWADGSPRVPGQGRSLILGPTGSVIAEGDGSAPQVVPGLVWPRIPGPHPLGER